MLAYSSFVYSLITSLAILAKIICPIFAYVYAPSLMVLASVSIKTGRVYAISLFVATFRVGISAELVGVPPHVFKAVIFHRVQQRLSTVQDRDPGYS